jgi:pimeloyl-ACP methyl ester carboxylesterase
MANSPEKFTDWLRCKFNRPYKLHIAVDEGKGPVIIFLHGIASSSASWGTLIPLLNNHYRCISIDLLGFGDSPKPAWSDYTQEQHLASIRRTINSLHLGQPFILVGHSLGSLLSIAYAKKYPREVKQLYLLSPPIYGSGSKKRAERAIMAYLRLYKYLRSNKQFTIGAAQRLQKILPINSGLGLTEETWVPFTRTLDQCIEHQTAGTDVAALKMPVDIFYGRFDEFVVGDNLLSLADNLNITVYRNNSDHIVGQKYALQVARLIVEHNHVKVSK